MKELVPLTLEIRVWGGGTKNKNSGWEGKCIWMYDAISQKKLQCFLVLVDHTKQNIPVIYFE